MQTDLQRTPGTKEYQEIEDKFVALFMDVKPSLQATVSKAHLDLLDMLKQRDQIRDPEGRKQFHLREIKRLVQKYREKNAERTFPYYGLLPSSLAQPILHLILRGCLKITVFKN